MPLHRAVPGRPCYTSSISPCNARRPRLLVSGGSAWNRLKSHSARRYPLRPPGRRHRPDRHQQDLRFADFFVIATAGNVRHMNALIDTLDREMKQLGVDMGRRKAIQSRAGCCWISTQLSCTSSRASSATTTTSKGCGAAARRWCASVERLLEYPAVQRRAAHVRAVRPAEEERDLTRGRLRPVRAVDEVAARLERQVAANRAGIGLRPGSSCPSSPRSTRQRSCPRTRRRRSARR